MLSSVQLEVETFDILWPLVKLTLGTVLMVFFFNLALHKCTMLPFICTKSARAGLILFGHFVHVKLHVYNMCGCIVKVCVSRFCLRFLSYLTGFDI